MSASGSSTCPAEEAAVRKGDALVSALRAKEAWRGAEANICASIHELVNESLARLLARLLAKSRPKKRIWGVLYSTSSPAI